ncbi:MAG TPA: TIGR00282 family metallophosphoesterase [Dehalococcoidia bacterium]|nr:TIGR00282 family metallophosphoesterase [Dehalococcoidia bacterium]
MHIVAIGDVVGKLGRRTIAEMLPQIRKEYPVDFVIANGENAAGGKGLTPSTADEMFRAGVDVITSGNHIWEHRDIYAMMNEGAPIIRPLNYPEGSPGRGYVITGGVAVVNAIGRVFMPADTDCPFRGIDKVLSQLQNQRIVLVDMHGEATSEKVAMGWYLAGRVSAVFGSHTHVPTADTRILPGGTAYVTDLGMTGPRDGIIGMEREPVLHRFLTQMPARFSAVEHGPAVINAILIDIDDETGKATSIQRIDREME